MSLNEYQQDKVNQLLKTDFKKQYDLIPKEYKHNYYFERFLFATADINAMIEFSIQHLKEAKKHSDFDISFETRKHNDDLITFVKYITTDGLRTEKRSMQVQLGKDGTLAFHGIFDFIYKEKNRNDTSVIYDLEMSLNEDKSKVLVTYSTLGKYPQAPCKCFLFSVFEPNGNELSRIAEALNFKTQETVFHEEFLPAGSINFNDLNIYQQKGEGNVEILNLLSFCPKIQQAKYHKDIQEVYAGKCTTKEKTQFAVCWKPNCFENEAYQKSIESISRFGAPGLNLSRTLTLNDPPWIIEISEQEYQKLVGNHQKEKLLQLKR